MTSDTIKLSDETSTINGDTHKVKHVDMVLIGSETGHLELRYPPSFSDNS
jgi:hypothetical protein